jgi:tRNA 2-selenouridine synthase
MRRVISLQNNLLIQEALEFPNSLFVDVRSPLEYAKGFIPGAVNIPLFDNEEREIVGLLYKEDRQKARLKGIDFASGKITNIIGKLEKLNGDKNLILYCWRGGMRSRSLHALLDTLGMQTFYLTGGYKAYRRFILDQLGSYQLQKPVFVLNGLTGVGKTEVLHLLEEMGRPTVDLEGLACHRGSLFGHLGIKKTPCQKQFDAFLWNRLEELKKENCLIVEGEGKRIGSVYQPDFLFQALQKGEHILLTAPLHSRVKRLSAEYIPTDEKEKKEIEEAILTIEKYIGKVRTKHLLSLLKKEDYKELISSLCQFYYDRLYSESKPDQTNFIFAVDSSDPREAALKIDAFIQEKIGTKLLLSP